LSLPTTSTFVSSVTTPIENKTVSYNPRHYEYTNLHGCIGRWGYNYGCRPALTAICTPTRR
jgi:hypothetical protein